MGSSLSNSRASDLKGSIALRGTIQSNQSPKDPLSMVSIYARNNVNKTPDSGLQFDSIVEEEPDF